MTRFSFFRALGGLVLAVLGFFAGRKAARWAWPRAEVGVPLRDFVKQREHRSRSASRDRLLRVRRAGPAGGPPVPDPVAAAPRSTDDNPADYLDDPAWRDFLARAKQSQEGKEPGWTASDPPETEVVRDEALAMMRDRPQEAGEILLRYAYAFDPASFKAFFEEFDITHEQAEAIMAASKAALE